MPNLDPTTWRWWTLLRAASVFNVLLLALTAWVVPIEGTTRWVHFLCCAIYVGVCGFRSFVPRVDLERIVLLDHWSSSIVLGRSAATVAELAFTVQCSLFLVALAENSGVGWLVSLAWVLPPLIAAAQTCCWLGVLTLNHLWHAAEEALWGAMMILLAAAFVSAWPGASGVYAWLMPLGLVSCAAGAFVMLVLDLPMYVKRHRQEVAIGTRFLSVAEGFEDALRRREPTGTWDTWRHEVAWMTPYFTAGVWLSIGMVWL